MNRALDLYQAGVWRFWLLLTAVFIAGGGLGASGSAGFIGLMLSPFLVRPAILGVASRPLVPALFVAAIAWAALSLSWSPYDRPDQALKLVLLSPLYILAVFAAAQMDDARARRRLLWIGVPILIVAGYFLVEALGGSPVASWVKVQFEGYLDPALTRAHADRALARAVTGYVIIAGPVALAFWVSKSMPARVAATVLLAAALAGGLAFGVAANLLSLVAGVAAAVLAWRFAGKGLAALCFIASALVIAAPFYMGALVWVISDEAAANLPLSWHMRLEIWRFALDQIAAAPGVGHGLDASRVLGGETLLRGVRVDQLPLHAHNAGLHIWLETGAVGAALFSLTLGALGWRCWRSPMQPMQAAGAAFAGAAFLATVMVGSGIWQEWLHGCLAIGCASAFMIRR
jgi:O-antigen ligase